MYDKSINIFETYSEYENSRGALLDITLNYIRETNETLSVKKPNYFYIESLEDNNKISFGVNDTWLGEKKSNIFYSFNKINWFSLSLVSSLTLSTNQYVYFKSDGGNLQKGEYTADPDSNTKKSLFKTTKKFNIGGNVKLLLYQNDNISSGGCQYLFYSLQVVDASNLVLPATELVESCYACMFYGCSSLTTAPELPATTLAKACYQWMFYNCTSLTTAPELPATELDNFCYNSMFHSCSSLTTAPELPATELYSNCYSHMFQNCTSLTTAPELPATELANWCYQWMFFGCTSLTTAPELPATKLTEQCYQSMFNGCNNLNYIKCLATDISASNCTTNWVDGVASEGKFYKHPDMNDWTTGVNGIPADWTVEDYVE